MPAEIDLQPIRQAMAAFNISPNVQPNDQIGLAQVFFPNGHRGVLDMKRQLVVGSRGMGKSFWTHALTDPSVREQLANVYTFPMLKNTQAIIGFNGSTKLSPVAPIADQIKQASDSGFKAELIWRAVILRAVMSVTSAAPEFSEVLKLLAGDPLRYSTELTSADNRNISSGSSILIVFDALDRLAHEWSVIQPLTMALLQTVMGLQSFRSVRAKVFMRVDQFADAELFRFPDSSKIRNDHVDLKWQPLELYGLLFFQLMRDENARLSLKALAERKNLPSALPEEGRLGDVSPEGQSELVAAIAGERMGRGLKRGRVYSWVPLHLGDAAKNCSPRTFLTAWNAAAQHSPAPLQQAVDHLGINEGVRKASDTRVTELEEDYPWIELVLAPLRRQFVPIKKEDLFDLWRSGKVVERIKEEGQRKRWTAPKGLETEAALEALLKTMTDIAVMEERANGKINVPDIFRVKSEILRKGGVAVPQKD